MAQWYSACCKSSHLKKPGLVTGICNLSS
ncbi:rCG27897 [Rattus norvegicus]|uniref:RCG27897 n=1 Tax=Rattus norvegicus TaxID=10116 RepID=A6IEJ2_RAT|nr:rCG27897 [Rattus norvegicus]